VGRATRDTVVLVMAAAIAAAVVGAAAPRPNGALSSTAKKRCHYVVKKVHGKKKRVRVCHKVKPKPKPKPVADLVALVAPGPSTADVGSALSYTVTVLNNGPGVALKTEVEPAIGWFPIDTPEKFLPGQITGTAGGKPCEEPDVSEGEATFACPVGSLASGASVQVTVSFRIGRVSGRELYVDTTAYTDSRDPNEHNSEAIANATMTGCLPSYPDRDICIAPPPPDLNCDDLFPYTNLHVNWAVADPDPHHLDSDHDGVACES